MSNLFFLGRDKFMKSSGFDFPKIESGKRLFFYYSSKNLVSQKRYGIRLNITYKQNIDKKGFHTKKS